MEFLKTQGTIIVNESGEEVLFKGFGMGNWLTQEGFLFGSSVFSTDFGEFVRAEKMDRGRSINQTIIELCGQEYAQNFWKKWQRNYFGKAEIEDLAKKGFNSVRLPLNARVFLKEEPGYVYDEEAFTMLDDIIDWCEENNLYVVLDMHAAVAGQSGLLCDDGVDNYPHLFTDAESWERTIVLWEKLAKRYADRSIIAGYELINEPLAIPRWDYLHPELIAFYKETIGRIRKIDKKHIIFLQGHRFSSRSDVFTEDMDPECHNWVWAAHIYETWPDLGLVGPLLESANRLGVPVWMGETGGSPEWMATFFEMLYENHIGVNVWCQKGVDDADAATLYTFSKPEGFDKVREYAHKGGSKPGYETSIKIFDQLLENIKLENCELHQDRCDAILRQPGSRVPAIGYDMLPGVGKSFQGKYPYCLFCGYRREDHMHLVYEKGFTPYEGGQFAGMGAGRTPKYGDWNHIQLMLEEGDFACYRLRNVTRETPISLECMAEEGGEVEVTARGVTTTISLPAKAELQIIKAGTVAAGDDTAVKVSSKKGNILVRTVIFS